MSISGVLAMARDRGSRLWRIQFSRFLAVGVLNTIIGYTVYVAAIWSGVPYQWALAVPTIILAFVNFFTTGGIVFDNTSFRRIAPFIAGYGIILFTNLAFLTILIRHGLSKELAQAMLLPVVVPLSFAINRRFVFREHT